MAKSKKNPFSLSAVIEQTAQMLRKAAPKKKDKPKKKGLSFSNRIEQIALLIRSESKKRKRN